MNNAERKKEVSLGHLIYLLVVLLLAGLWVVVLLFTQTERSATLERAREQLFLTVITLADFNQLAEEAAGLGIVQSNDARTEALWRALLQYPAASIWVEAEGAITGGFPPASLDGTILVEEARPNFIVYAALAEDEALGEWRLRLRERLFALAAATVALLALTYLLVRALQQRTLAERKAAATEERNRQLVLYRERLETTVAERTVELKDVNARLADELGVRKVTEATLREHDALLSSVTKGAAELLGSHNYADAISSVLELIGQTLAVSRVQLNATKSGRDGHLYSSIAHEWTAPGTNPLINDPRFQNVDIAQHFPRTAAALQGGGVTAFFIEDIPEQFRAFYSASGMYSFLQIPVHVDNKLWGGLVFIDSVSTRRAWSWAEMDTLKTLAGLIGVAMTTARYLKELADANTIVQNSPTILFRLKGEPSFPLIYISHNIIKFGHQAKALVEDSNWMETLVEPEDREALHKAMARMLEPADKGAALEFRLRTGSSDIRWVENRYTPVRDDNGRLIEVEGIIIDITERKAAEEKIAAMARTDALTGLANRTTFTERLTQAFAASRRGAAPFAVFYMDLDRFKTINDTLGHPVGDLLLKEVASRLRQATRETDLVARLGGDEFAILQMDVNEAANAGVLAQNIQKALSRPMLLDGNDLHVTCSIGICPWAPDSKDPDSMMTQADLALYRAKEEGRNCYRFHSIDLDREVLERTELAEELRLAIDGNQLHLAYQPQVSIAHREIVGVEALVRWQHQRMGLLDAREFIQVAETTGTIMALGHWVLNEACRQLRQWRDEGIRLNVITLNLSAIQLKNSRELVDDVKTTTAKWGLQPSNLEFDVTEAMLAQTTWTQNDVLSQLHALGCKIAIDNFGSEYSSFDYLRAYAVNHLKIARKFIQDAITVPERASTLKAIIQLARDLGIGVIVEGVETEAQSEFLLEINRATNAQGYYYSGAVDGSAAGAMLKSMHTAAPARKPIQDTLEVNS